jgi:hypothetical protein
MTKSENATKYELCKAEWRRRHRKTEPSSDAESTSEIKHLPRFPLVALLAATGIRLSEALSLNAHGKFATPENYYDASRALIHIERSTNLMGRRDVYLPASFNEWFIRAKLPYLHKLSLFAAIKRFNLPPTPAYRRFRITHLRNSGMDGLVSRRQIGHAKHTPGHDEAFARAEVERCGVGFAF